MTDQPTTARRNRRLYLGLAAINAVLFGLLAYIVIDRLANARSDSPTIDGDWSSGATVYDPPRALRDFTLTTQSSERLSLSDLRGRMGLLFFGFTHCPDVCPTTLLEFKRVKQALGDDANEVAFVFISVDGVRDTPEVLARYLADFDPDFIGLTGDEVYLRQIGADYDLFFERREMGSEGGYTVDHTASSFLIDREGRLVMKFAFGTEPEAIAAAIRERL